MTTLMRTSCKSVLVALLLIACQGSGASAAAPNRAAAGVRARSDATVRRIQDHGGEALEPGRSLLDILKQLSTAWVEGIPADRLNMGLATFPNPAPLKWGMAVLTDLNRSSLTDAINGLAAGGESSLDAALTFAGLQLAADMQRPRFLLIFSDGGVCPNGNEGILSMAAYLRDWMDIFIITVGYNLQGLDLETMRDIASLQTDGTPAFFHSQSPGDLIGSWNFALGLICDWLRARITTTSPSYLIGRLMNPGGSGGTANIDYAVRYLQGSGGVVKVLAAGPFLTAGGTARVEPPSASLSATAPLFADKIMLQTAGAPAGDYDLMLSVVTTDGGGAVAAQTVQVSVVPITFTAYFESGYPSYSPSTRTINGRFAVGTVTPADTPLQHLTIRIEYKITEADGTEGAWLRCPNRPADHEGGRR